MYFPNGPLPKPYFPRKIVYTFAFGKAAGRGLLKTFKIIINMNKLLIASMALLAFASCKKSEVNDPVPPIADGANVTVSFVSEPAATRAFFDATASAEA